MSPGTSLGIGLYFNDFPFSKVLSQLDHRVERPWGSNPSRLALAGGLSFSLSPARRHVYSRGGRYVAVGSARATCLFPGRRALVGLQSSVKEDVSLTLLCQKMVLIGFHALAGCSPALSLSRPALTHGKRWHGKRPGRSTVFLILHVVKHSRHECESFAEVLRTILGGKSVHPTRQKTNKASSNRTTRCWARHHDGEEDRHRSALAQVLHERSAMIRSHTKKQALARSTAIGLQLSLCWP